MADFWEYEETYAAEAEQVAKSRTAEHEAFVTDYLAEVPAEVRHAIEKTGSTLTSWAEVLPAWLEVEVIKIVANLEMSLAKTTLALSKAISGILETFLAALELLREWALATFATLVTVNELITTKLNEWSSSIWTKILAWWQPQLAKLNEWWSAQLVELGQWWETQLAELVETFSFVLEFRDDIIDLFTDPEAWLLKRLENMLVRFW